jgi:predicted ester cyclase
MSEMLIRCLLILICTVCLLSIISVSAQESLKDKARAIMTGLYEQGTIDEALFAPEFVRHPGQSDSRALLNTALTLRAAVPDLQTSVEVMLEQDDLVAVRLWLSGTFQNEFIAPNALPLPPTGKPVKLVVHIIYRLNAAGQLVEEWDGFDNLHFYEQFGVLPSSSTPQPQPMLYPEVVDVGMLEQNRTVISQFFDAYNRGDWNFINTGFKEDFTSHGPFGDLSRTNHVTDLTRLRNALPDLSASLDQLITEGNWTAALYIMRGTFTGNFVAGNNPPIPPTGQPLDLLVITFFRFDQQGLVAEAFELYDSLDFMTQLGLVTFVVLPTATPAS